MGCGGSKDGAVTPPDNSLSYDRRPKISVRIGPEVKNLDTTPRVIFVFGGPGSKKGRIVDDLVNSYGFKFVSAEDTIIEELPRKLQHICKVSGIQEIKAVIEDEPHHLTLEWVLSMIERKIEKFGDSNATYLVDMIPNLKFMLKCTELIKEADGALGKFERRYPISFAINLAIPADRVIQSKNVCSTPEAGEKMKETGGQGDEADSGRMQRRAAVFEQVARHFLDYFAKNDRLVTVDVTSGVADLIWHRVHRFLCDLDFHPNRTVNTVIYFAFSDSDASHIDYDRYLMEKVQLTSLVENPQDSVENLLTILGQHIDNNSKQADSFVAILTGTSINSTAVQQVDKRPIIFLHVDQGYLEAYLPGSPKNFVPSKTTTEYKAVISMENEICLFPIETSNEVCTKIALLMTNNRLVL